MDISASTQTSLDIFRLIIDQGPLTLYSASTQSSFPLGTIHRHFKEMQRAEKIKSYGDSSDGRKKKPYGPTVHGFVYYSRIDKHIKSRLENYFLLWLDHVDFQDDLKKNGFDVDAIIQNPKKSKELFRKYVDYCGLIENQLDHLKNDWDSIPRDFAIFIGEVMLLTNQPSHFKTWQELYLKMPGLRNYADSHLNHMQKLQVKLHKQIRH